MTAHYFYVARFFFVLRVVPPLISGAFALATAVGAAALVIDVDHGIRTVAPVLLLQLFAAASGFCIPARRGHYDLLFTSGESRLSIAVMHWVMSVFPGAVSWFTLATVERVYGGNSLVGSATLLSLLVVSTVPWCLTVPFPRLTGGIAWLLVFALTTAVLPGPDTSAAGLLLPWALLRAPVQPWLAVCLVALVAAGMAGTFVLISQMDVPLESSQ
jgi:hypothetical protein